MPTAALGPDDSRGLPRALGALALLKRLAHDERGEAYVAVRPEGVDRTCVVHLLSPAYVGRAGVADRLRAQADWLVARVHGNLVQTYDVGRADERLFLVNELVEGRDLSALIAAAGVVPPEVAVFVALEVAAALGFVRGNEHRLTGVETTLLGMSASAVIAARDGSVKLLHHGSGLAAPPEALAGKDLAHVALIAPEHVDGGGSDAGDVYAVGALLWQMLAGRPLAQEATGAAHLEALRAGRFTAPPLTAVPAPVAEVVSSALLQRPEDRPATCEALRAQLGSVLRGLGGSGPESVRELVLRLFGPAIEADAAELARLAAEADRELGRAAPRARSATLTNFEPGSGASGRAVASRDSELALGQVIPGTRYRALEKLGEGGMGAVYAAEHVDIERRVALKLVHSELLRNPLVLRQFRQEARAASRIGNPYICDVTDWGELADGRVFFVMEYLDGPSLGKVLKQKRRLPAARCIPILRQVAKALGAAHEKGIVHLDVKPDNVLLLEKHGRGDAVKVVDFGVAGILGRSGGAAKVMGTPEYMAPERVTGRGYDHRSDIYSLGVMAYEMLVGEVPFQGNTPIETLAMQASDAPDPIRERSTAKIPEPVETAVMSLLQKDPARRPQSMAEVEALLLEAQLDGGIRTPWDDLPLPAVAAERVARIERRLHAPARYVRFFAMGAAGAAAIMAAVTVHLATRAPEVVIKERAAPAVVQPTIRPLPAPQPPPPPVAEPAAAAVAPPRPAAEPPPRSRPRREEATAEPAAAARHTTAARQALARGAAALAAGSVEQAKNDFELAAAADPRNPAAVGGLAEVAFERAKYEEAVHFATRAARLAPRAAKYLIILGDASYRLARYADALKAYQRALAVTPGDEEILARLANVEAKLGGK